MTLVSRVTKQVASSVALFVPNLPGNSPPVMEREIPDGSGSRKRRLVPLAPAPAGGSGQGASAGAGSKGRRQVTAACESCRRRKSKVRKCLLQDSCSRLLKYISLHQKQFPKIWCNVSRSRSRLTADG